MVHIFSNGKLLSFTDLTSLNQCISPICSYTMHLEHSRKEDCACNLDPHFFIIWQKSLNTRDLYLSVTLCTCLHTWKASPLERQPIEKEMWAHLRRSSGRRPCWWWSCVLSMWHSGCPNCIFYCGCNLPRQGFIELESERALSVPGDPGTMETLFTFYGAFPSCITGWELLIPSTGYFRSISRWNLSPTGLLR